jgi:hypothetical protein
VVSRRLLALLVISALVLPIVICVLMAVGRFLSAMQDEAGALFVERLALAGGVVWGVDLIVLLIAMGINMLGGDGPPETTVEE